ncbi:RNA-binding protein Pasilla-like isoform X1 [Ylistrum balloti]|uniref:RNA-binding protein Pasilla-like isoform X1 n=1 Tax=Ylistrum balloti TaxID=509963 RepID=UPI002905D289|nr:RNA-binding protein Pasilla-like isoform X1 [Ylistrum balloti]
MAMNYDNLNGGDMDTSDSRKRPLDTEVENGVPKRSNQGGGTPEQLQHMMTDDSNGDAALGDNIHLKILVPSIAAGAIIGKGGETIAQVQKEAGARVKMSKANDFYPGTTERVCLIMGGIEAVRRVQNFIMEKIREKPDPNPKPEETNKNFERHRQVKVLVPNSTAGMIIGKGGNYIKQIKEESGAYIQISQKSKETNLPERCVTVAGDHEANRKAVDLILQKVVEDPQSGSCPNISYADYTGPVASANPTGSPFANTNFTQSRSQEMVVNNSNYPQQGATAYSIGFNGNGFNNSIGSGISNLNLNAALGGAPGGSMSSGALDNLKMTLRSSGYSEQATEEISIAMNTLASYGILGMIGLNQVPGVSNVGPMANMPVTGGAGNAQMAGINMASSMAATNMMVTPTSSQQNVNNGSYLNTSSNSATGSLFGPVGSGTSGLGSSGSTGAGSSLFGSSSPSIGNERYGGSPMLNDSFTGATSYTSNPATYPPQAIAERSPNINLNQNSFGLGTGMCSPTEDKQPPQKQDLEVSESIVGAILGPGGKGIVELQKFTQTNIQISKKGVYVPGTRNRIVTITGIANNIQKATYLIQQRIQQEEIKRAHQAAR